MMVNPRIFSSGIAIPSAMARTPDAFTYNIETLANLSGWPANRVHQDVHREGIDISYLRDAAFWLASNGTPEVRAEMAKRLIPAVLGSRRRTDENEMLFNQASSYDLMLEVFRRDRMFRDQRAKKIIRTRKRAARERA